MLVLQGRNMLAHNWSAIHILLRAPWLHYQASLFSSITKIYYSTYTINPPPATSISLQNVWNLLFKSWITKQDVQALNQVVWGKWSLLALSQCHNIYNSAVLKLQNVIMILSVIMSLFNLCIPMDFKSHSALSWQEFECKSKSIIIWKKKCNYWPYELYVYLLQQCNTCQINVKITFTG
jgi:hypothetical protein